MPNWCDCDLTITGPADDLDRFLTGFAPNVPEGPTVLDFNFVIPMPQELKDTTSGGYGSAGYDAWYGDCTLMLTRSWVVEAGVTNREELQVFLREKNPQYEEEGNKYRDNIEKYGHPNWYDWANEKWGTKWNEPDVAVSRGQPETLDLSFMTAWSPPEPVIEAAAKQFPTLRFNLRYYECGMGYQGQLVCEGGEVTTKESSDDYRGHRGG